jgi:prepilin-type N-terminal cleavage/methylation domain-containing protein
VSRSADDRAVLPGRFRTDERGFTIIETMAAILIIAVAFLGLAGTHAVASRAQSLGQNQGLATYVADQQLELMRRSTFANVVNFNGTQTVEGVTFTINRTSTTIGSNKRVQVQTSWTDRFGPHAITIATVVSQVTNP